jgi:DNA transposition AAA+ family ATPase
MNSLAIEIIRELKGKNLLLIVDQADYLNIGMIDVFRTINEEAGVGVVFVGLPSFLSKLRGNQPEVRQLRDRLVTRLELKRFTLEDCKKILDMNYPGLNGYSKDFYVLSNGSIRIMSAILYNVKKMTARKKYELDSKLILDAAKLLERSVVE